MREIDKKAIPFLKNKGYGKGTNYTTDLVASLMLQFSKEQGQELPIHNVSKCKCKNPNHWIKTHNELNVDYCRICNLPL